MTLKEYTHDYMPPQVVQYMYDFMNQLGILESENDCPQHKTTVIINNKNDLLLYLTQM